MGSFERPILVVIAGPNGAGKSTLYQEHLSHFPFPFVNADLIAVEHLGDNLPETAVEAVRIADQVRKELVVARQSFIFETVLSDPVGAKVEFLAATRRRGFYLSVHFVGLSSSTLSKASVVVEKNGSIDLPIFAQCSTCPVRERSASLAAARASSANSAPILMATDGMIEIS